MEGYLRLPATLPEFLSESDTERELSPEVTIKEEMIEEVMQELYKEIAWPTAAATCKEEIAESAEELVGPGYVENGKSESCGASMSETASSVMAGVKFAEGNMWVVVEEEEGRMMDGCDGTEEGDEWLERVMEWSPVEMEGGWGHNEI